MDLQPKKSLGQHWLYDPASLQAVCDCAEVGSSDTVLEIGPGLGTLTSMLLARAKEVIAVEFDHDLAENLAGKQLRNLTVLEQDILNFDFSTMPVGYKIAANIPYYITAHLLRVISETPHRPEIAALLVQKEVAERVAATPGEMSLLAVATQYYYEVSLGAIVPAELFTPPPKVHSQILILHARKQQPFGDIDTKKFFRIIRAGFSQRRKKLRSSLSGGLQLDKTSVDELLTRTGIDGNLRAQNLGLDDWHKLYEVF